MAQEYTDLLAGKLPEKWDSELDALANELSGDIATRGASGKVLNAIAKHLKTVLGGSADLGTSVKTVINDSTSIGPSNFAGRNLHFGKILCP